MEKNIQMKLYYPGYMEITNKWSCITLSVWKIIKKMELFSPTGPRCMDNNRKMKLCSKGV
jgi:hypothetical protein